MKDDPNLRNELTRHTALVVSKVSEADASDKDADSRLTISEPGSPHPDQPELTVPTRANARGERVSQSLRHESTSSAWSPRLNYGVLLNFSHEAPDPYDFVRNLELEIRAGQDSFAARLFHATVDFAHKEICQMMGPLPLPPSRLFKYTSYVEPIGLTLRRTVECIERMTYGGGISHHELARSEMSATATRVQRHVATSNEFEDEFFDLYDTEEYLKRSWAVQVSPITVKRKAMNRNVDGRLIFTDTIIGDSRIVASQIASGAVCWGDGPRYPKTCIDQCMRTAFRSSLIY